MVRWTEGKPFVHQGHRRFVKSYGRHRITDAQDLAVGAIGWGLGLNGTNSPTDCMCGWANECESQSGACSLSPSIATTPSLSPATTCPNQNPQNEVAAFSTKFCQ